jgi:isopenicillin-N epimerase
MPEPPPPIPGARLLFSLDPGTAHLNHGSFGAVPIPVQRVQQRLRDEMDANPVRFLGSGLSERLGHPRRHLATFLGADPEGSALVANVTAAVAIVLATLDLRHGDEVVMTDHGYGGVTIALADACRRAGATLRTVALPLEADDAAIVKGVRDAVNGQTRLVVIDQITSPTARLFPVAQVIAAVRDEQSEPTPAILVDGAHAPGLLSTPVTSLGADFWVGNLHKWGFAPRGTALLAVAPGWRPRIRPLIVSWGHDAGFPTNIEYQATIDYTPWLAAPAGLFTLRTLGLDLVREHNAALAEYGQRVVGAALGLGAADLPGSGGATPLPMRVVPLPEGIATDPASAEALRRRISSKLEVEVGLNAWQGRGLLRLSAQAYNRPEEYDRLADALPTLLQSGSPTG